MSESSADRDHLDRLAEEFVARFRKGERPSITEYAERLPDRADEIRDLFPALVEMEQLKPVTGDWTSDFAVEPTDPLRVGEFQILRRVGQGGMGIVYEALQESLGRHVALKLLPSEAVADPSRLERFRREAKSAAKLHHTNIVPVFGVGEADGRHYYAMQFIAGHPIDAVIEEVRRMRFNSTENKLPPRPVSEIARAMVTGTFIPAVDPIVTSVSHASTDASRTLSVSNSSSVISGSLSDDGRHYWATVARIGAQVADGLAYAHGQGVLHRDIKPANLLLDLQGTVWVTDFGLAKSADADDLTQMGDIVGTLRYIAPERFDGSGDHRADIYALGLTLYELLTLKPAFAAENRAKLVEQVIAAHPANPRSVNPSIPKDLETIVLKATARDPAMRYQSAAELAEDLQRYLEDRPIRARRATAREQAWRWCRRNPAVGSLMAAVILVFAVGTVVSWAFAVQAERKEKDARDEANRADEERDRANQEATRARAGEDSIRRLLYDSLLNRAAAAFKEDRVPLVMQLLEESRPGPGEPDLRGWEWHYLYRLLNPVPEREVSLKEKGELLVETPDHRRIVTTRQTGLELFFEAWDLPSGRRLSQFPKVGTIPKQILERSGLSSGLEHFTLTADGKYFGIIIDAKPEHPEWPDYQLRIWNTETGEELHVPDPAPSKDTRSFVIGPDAVSVVWVEWPRPVQPADGGGWKFGPSATPIVGATGEKPTITVSRWDRATKKKTQTSFTPDAFQLAQLSPDGRRVYLVPGLGLQGGLPRMGAELRFECWDVAGQKATRVWTSSVDWAIGGFRGGYAFSRSGTALGIWTDNGVSVYRLRDGKLIWKMLSSSTGGLVRGDRLSDIGDDGTWCVFLRQNRICRIARTSPADSELTGEGKVVPTHETVLRIRGDQYPYRAPALDGQSVMAYDPEGSTLRFFDASRDASWTESPAEAGVIAWLESKSDPTSPVSFGPGRPQGFEWVVRSAAGKELFRLLPQDTKTRQPRLLVNGRRLLIQKYRAPRGPIFFPQGGETWELFATDTNGAIELLASGDGIARADEASGILEIRARNEDLQPVFRNLLTGKVVGSEHSPLSGEITAKYCASPNGDHYAILTWHADPDDPHKPLDPAEKSSVSVGMPSVPVKLQPVTLRLYATGTGKEVWRREIGSARVGNINMPRFRLAFSPDGCRIVLTYPPDLDGETRVWIGRTADGVEERLLRVRESDKGYTPVLTFRGFTNDGKLLLTNTDSVQVWDAETGRKTMDLRGNGQVGDLFVTADGSRLFVKDFGSMGTGQILIWDFITGRMLMALESPLAFSFTQIPFELRNGRIHVIDQYGIHAFDGSPVKP